MSRKSDPKQSRDTVQVRPASDDVKPVRRSFPGPTDAQASLRVAIDAQAYAEFIGHAKEFLQVEVCGVLIGHMCQDERGPFTHVQAVIRGHAASSGSTHVTFTQEAWTSIHETLEKEYPKLRMVGWYHTHPGFGVDFSDMDIFIQRNFFPAAGQIGLLTDPLSGAVALMTQNEDALTTYLPRFWVDGRECVAVIPANQGTGATHPGGSPVGPSYSELEARVVQLTRVVEDLRSSLSSFLFFAMVLVMLAVAGCAGWFIYQQFGQKNQPPQLNSIIPVPIKLGDKNVLIGMGVVSWEIPADLNAALIEVEKEKAKEAVKSPADAAKPSPAPQPASGATPSPAPDAATPTPPKP